MNVIALKEMEEEAIYLGTISAIYKGKIGPPENIFGNDLYKQLNDRNRIVTFTNLVSWKKFVEGAEICLSSRFHGAVVSIMAEVPTIVIPIDSRMRELCSYHRIPAVDKMKLDSLDIEDILKTIDFDVWKSVWAVNRDRYISFLNRNEITHTLELSGELPYDCMVKKVEWEEPAVNWNELSVKEKITRSEDYFIGKIQSRVSKQSIIEKWRYNV